jgi:hypothetical protein
MYYSKIGNIGAGFTNQIFALIGSIQNAYIKGEKIIIVDHFLNDINNISYSPISDIFNITKINEFLYTNYGLIIIDKYNARLDIIKINYGTNEMNYDITDFIKKKYFNNTLFIDKNCNFNDIKGDPCPGVIKNIIIKYKIGDYFVEELYNERMNSTIEININGPYLFTLGLINSSYSIMFDNILKNITFNIEFILKSDIILKEININKKINIIHLRLEKDAILHWSKQNNMTIDNFESHLKNKYINLIKKYISNADENIILSSSLSNGVIDFLNNHNYKYRFVDKIFKDREKNAIIDLLVSKCCNNIFIGNFNINKNRGSSFSYYIFKCMNNIVNNIYIDLDYIYDEEVVVLI